MRSLVPPLLVLIAMAAGCERTYRTAHIDDEIPAANVWMVRTLQDEGVENAIIAQQTLFPYHFTRDSVALTPVGERDIRVLASHYQRHPGALTVRRGEEPEGLYRARLQHVGEALARAGVDPSTIQMQDGLPGGEGLRSERVIAILKKDAQRGTLQTGSTTGGEQ